jgi:hypothetical protein
MYARIASKLLTRTEQSTIAEPKMGKFDGMLKHFIEAFQWIGSPK